MFLKRRRKKQYYSNKISAVKYNIKKTWKVINYLLNKRTKSINIDCLSKNRVPEQFIKTGSGIVY